MLINILQNLSFDYSGCRLSDASPRGKLLANVEIRPVDLSQNMILSYHSLISSNAKVSTGKHFHSEWVCEWILRDNIVINVFINMSATNTK